MKHVALALLALCLPFSLAACGNETSSPVGKDTTQGTIEPGEIDGGPEPYHPDAVGAKLMEENPKLDASSLDCLSGLYKTEFSKASIEGFLEEGSAYFTAEAFAASPDGIKYGSPDFEGKVMGCTVPVDRPPFDCRELQAGESPDTSVSSDCTYEPPLPGDPKPYPGPCGEPTLELDPAQSTTICEPYPGPLPPGAEPNGTEAHE